MLEGLSLEETEETPRIVLNAESGTITLSGRSLPEDAIGYYEPVLEWIEAYITTPQPLTTLSFELDYFNSASAKQLLEILLRFEAVHALPDKEVTVNWYYEEGDDLIESRGKEMADMIKLPFVFPEY